MAGNWGSACVGVRLRRLMLVAGDCGSACPEILAIKIKCAGSIGVLGEESVSGLCAGCVLDERVMSLPFVITDMDQGVYLLTGQ